MNAYALGCTDESLRKELLSMKESGVEIEENYGGKTSLKSRILLEEVSSSFFHFTHAKISTYGSCLLPPCRLMSASFGWASYLSPFFVLRNVLL